MRIAVGCDHRGFELKRAVIEQIEGGGYGYEDFGCYGTEPVDYPDIAHKVAKAVASGEFKFGILMCDTGIGMSIVANKVRGIRAALCHDAFSASRARQHNDANILCLGTRNKDNLEIVNAFLSTQFDGGRHLLRLNKIVDMECS